MRKKLLLLMLAALMVPCLMGMTTSEKLERQAAAHDIAEIGRSLGLPETDPLIQRAQEIWWEAESSVSEPTYTEYERDIVATVIYNEAWGGCSDRHRELVAAVICNRVADPRFPDTIYDVVVQKGQYHPGYVNPQSIYGQKARADAAAWSKCQAIADKALRGEVICDPGVLYQANFRQGYGVYETHYTSYSTTYFCYG